MVFFAINVNRCVKYIETQINDVNNEKHECFSDFRGLLWLAPRAGVTSLPGGKELIDGCFEIERL